MCRRYIKACFKINYTDHNTTMQQLLPVDITDTNTHNDSKDQFDGFMIKKKVESMRVY